MPVCFLMRDRKGLNLDGREGGEELRGVGGKKHDHNILYDKKIHFQ